DRRLRDERHPRRRLLRRGRRRRARGGDRGRPLRRADGAERPHVGLRPRRFPGGDRGHVRNGAARRLSFRPCASTSCATPRPRSSSRTSCARSRRPDEPSPPRARDGRRDREGDRHVGRARRAAGARRHGRERPRRRRGPRRPRGRGRAPAGLRPGRGRADRRRRAALPRRRHARRRAAVSAVRVDELHKSYGAFEALRGVSFEITAGEVFGLLGPNGAGKTTTVEILEGYRERDSGEVAVLGEDPERASREWRERIGIVLQSSAMYANLTVVEQLRLFAGYYRRPRDVDEVIRLVGLDEKRGARVRGLSGGQKRRLDLGLALVGDPDLLFLDEPTTGFDPAARRAAWEMIRSLRSLGKTILLTTHYLDEAEQLSDRVAVLREGRIVALGRPAELAGSAPATEIRYRRNGEEVLLRTSEPTRVLNELTSEALAEGFELEDLNVRRPTLEE